MSVLPEELLQLIFSFLQTTIDVRRGYIDYAVLASNDIVKRTTLSAICLASKTCCRLAQRYLYTCIQLYDCKTNPAALLRTLMRKPKLAERVRELRVGPEFGIKEDVYPPEDDFVQDARHFTRNLRITQKLKDDILARVGGFRTQTSAATLLLTVCTNLELLDMTAIYGLEETLHGRFIREAAMDSVDQQPEDAPLAHLRDVHVEHWDTEGTSDIEAFVDILRLRSIETFTARSIRCLDDVNFAQTSSNLQKARFVESLFDAEGIAAFLRACPKLQNLSIEWGGPLAGSCEIKWNLVGDALREHGKALQVLTLDLGVEDYFFDNETIIEPLGELKSLSSLRRLAVPEFALFGEDDSLEDGYPNFLKPTMTETLPESLESLKISRCDDDMQELLDQQLEDLMTDVRFGKLSAVSLKRGYDCARDVEELGWKEARTKKGWHLLRKL